jgi:hypothetical protein
MFEVLSALGGIECVAAVNRYTATLLPNRFSHSKARVEQARGTGLVNARQTKHRRSCNSKALIARREGKSWQS